MESATSLKNCATCSFVWLSISARTCSIRWGWSRRQASTTSSRGDAPCESEHGYMQWGGRCIPHRPFCLSVLGPEGRVSGYSSWGCCGVELVAAGRCFFRVGVTSRENMPARCRWYVQSGLFRGIPRMLSELLINTNGYRWGTGTSHARPARIIYYPVSV